MDPGAKLVVSRFAVHGQILDARLFRGVSACRDGPRPLRDPVSDPVQPVAQQLTLTQRPRLPHQHEKRGLEGVLNIIRVA
jgi:hypothetical protein